MGGLFHYDGFVVQTANRITDCICLSLLWLVSSLPLVTIGAATTALYYAMNKCVRRSEGSVWKTYWQAFRANFRQSTLLWLVVFLVNAFVSGCGYCTYLMCLAGNLPKEMLYFSLLVMALVFLWSSFLFPYLARFQNSNRLIMKNCIYIAIMNFPAGLLHLAYLAVSLIAIAFFPLTILCMPGVYMVLSCYTLEPVFKKYMTSEDRAKVEALEEMA